MIAAMLASSPMNAFVPTRNFAAARSFYEGVLGLRLESENDYVAVFRSGGSMLIMQKVREFTPAPYTVLGWEVDDIREMVSSLKEKGVGFERYPWMQEQDELGIWKSPDAKVAWFKDPDGNTLSLSEH
jgi:catechol 2,3-dioxygenase-like lactoylglutathione lyase family enzyme